MTAAGPSNGVESSWDQRLLHNPAGPAAFKPEYQELKFTLHRKLLERINLDALSGIDDDRIRDRKSTRLNSSHLGISYAVFCLKKKKIKTHDSKQLSYALSSKSTSPEHRHM